MPHAEGSAVHSEARSEEVHTIREDLFILESHSSRVEIDVKAKDHDFVK